MGKQSRQKQTATSARRVRRTAWIGGAITLAALGVAGIMSIAGQVKTRHRQPAPVQPERRELSSHSQSSMCTRAQPASVARNGWTTVQRVR